MSPVAPPVGNVPAPTREELTALADACEIAARTVGRSVASIVLDGEGKAAEELLMRAADRLRTYPLPAAEGKREELARRLARNAKLMENGQFTEDVVPLMRRAAALLQVPAAGVSVEAVFREIGRFKGGGPQVEGLKRVLSEAIRALPEQR